MLLAGGKTSFLSANEERLNIITPIAKPEKIEFVDTLPKTRSGKIIRRVLKAKALGQDLGNLTTLED